MKLLEEGGFFTIVELFIVLCITSIMFMIVVGGVVKYELEQARIKAEVVAELVISEVEELEIDDVQDTIEAVGDVYEEQGVEEPWAYRRDKRIGRRY